MRIISKFKTAALLLLMPIFALADQAAYISKDDAVRAKELLSNTNTVKSYCAPCSDQEVDSISINKIDIADVNYENYWEVQINDEGVDLAYLYFLSNGKWRNVAITLGLQVSDVPEFIGQNETQDE